MKKNFAKVLSVFLAVLMLMSVVPMTSSAATSNGYTYTVSNGKASITDFDMSISGEITIPATIGGYPVTVIANRAFEQCMNLTKVTIPESVTKIGDYAFQNCTAITEITIPETVESIGKSAFFSCFKLTSIKIPDLLKTIEEGTFESCYALTEIIIPENVTSIGLRAFSDCRSLTSITIPASVTSIGSCFGDCYSLTEIIVDANNKYFSSDSNGVLFNKDKTTLIRYPEGKTAEAYTIPSTVTSIGGAAFSGCNNLKNIIIPDSVTSIGGSAFSHCEKLKSIIIPDSVTKIEDSTFYQCFGLESVTIGSNVTSIGRFAFGYCNTLTDVYFSGDEEAWGKITIGATNEKLTNANIHFAECQHNYVDGKCSECGALEIIASGICGDNLTWTIDSEGTLTISGTGAMYDYKNPYDFTVEEGAAPWTDYSGKIKNLRLEEGITYIGERAFFSCNFNYVEIPEGVTRIGSVAFMTTDIYVIRFPSTLEYIGEMAFFECYKIVKICYNGTQEEWKNVGHGRENEPIFLNTEHKMIYNFTDDSILASGTAGENITWSLDAKGTLVVSGSGEMTSAPWKELNCVIKNVIIEDGITNVYPNAFQVQDSPLLSVSLPDSVTDIGHDAFSACLKLEEIVLPANLSSVGGFAFYMCDSLTDVYYPGVEKEWNEIAISTGNSSLKNAAIHFEYCAESDTNKHIYTSEVITPSTHIKEGELLCTCECGYSYIAAIEKLEGHTYEQKTVTAPTCTAQGYTTYTCACGDSYVGDYVDTVPHNYVDGKCSVCGAIEIIVSGTCGDGVEWTLDAFGTLTVFGNGKIDGVQGTWEGTSDLTSSPWHQYKELIKKIIVSEGITEIGTSAFRELTYVREAEIAGSVKIIDQYAFLACRLLKKLTLADGIEEIRYCAFRETAIEELYIPASVKVLELDSFGIIEALKSVHIGNGNINIAYESFYSCENLKEVYIENCASIEFYAFSCCFALEKITVLSRSCEVKSFNEYSYPQKDTLLCGYSDSTLAEFARNNSRPFVPIDVSDDYVILSGDIGDTAQYKLTKDGILKISGSGEMYQWITENIPWKNYNKLIKEIIVEYGITELGSFRTCDSVSVMYIPSSVTSFGIDNFQNCKALLDIYYYGTEAEWALIKDSSLDGASKSNLRRATVHFNYCPANENFTHVITSTVTPNTCTAGGYTTNVCDCGYTYISDETEATGHNYRSYVLRSATHTSTGTMMHDCRNCTYYYQTTIPKTEGHTYKKVVTAPTCTKQGYTTYTCACGDTYVADYVNANGHAHNGSVTTPATHLKDGVMTYTCHCGDSYTEAIAKLEEHTYNSSVTAPTCTAQGYTTYTCVCGDTYVADYVNANGHAHNGSVTTPATHLKDGVMTYTCHCGDSYTEAIAKLEEHTYNSSVTAPTCTAQGYTTYTCVCGDTYVADYVNTTGHSHIGKVTTPATHLKEGVMTYTCHCGDTYTEAIAKLTKHTYKSKVTTAATHTTQGVKTYTCECGDSYTVAIPTTTEHTYQKETIKNATCTQSGTRLYFCECGSEYTETISAKGHKDSNGDVYCDSCGTAVCSHMCHQTGFMGFIWKIVKLFWSLFKMNPVCECGLAHY